MHMQNFYLEVESFTKSGDEFGRIKYWRMTFNLPKFSLPQFYTIRYTQVFFKYICSQTTMSMFNSAGWYGGIFIIYDIYFKPVCILDKILNTAISLIKFHWKLCIL